MNWKRMTAAAAFVWAGAGLAATATDGIANFAERVRAYEHRWKNALAAENPVRVAGSGTGSFSGTVRGLDSAAIGTAYVEAWSVETKRDSIAWPVTYGAAPVRDDYSYTVEGLLPGRYLAYAHADGYEARYFPNAVDPSLADTLVVRENTDLPGIDFNLPKILPGTGGISGDVIDAQTGAPIRMAVVYAFESDRPYHFGKAETDGNGRFRIPDLFGGVYRLEAYADGYLNEIYRSNGSADGDWQVTVNEPNDTGGIRFRLDHEAVISGTVTDREGRPLAGAWIQAYVPTGWDSSASDSGAWKPIPESANGGSASTGEDGTYRISGLQAGEYLVEAQVWGAWYNGFQWYDAAVSADRATPVIASAGEETGRIDFRFAVPGASNSISGVVTDQEGNPVSGASLQAYTDDGSGTGSSFWAYATTDAQGRYDISKIPNGQYLVTCWAQIGWQYAYRYWPASETVDGAGRVSVDGTTAQNGIDFRIPLSAGKSAIDGIVRRTDGRPLASASVQVVSKSESADGTIRSLWAYANTDSSGRYRVEWLPAGTYTVQCTFWEGVSMGQGWYNGADAESLATPILLGGREKRTGIDFTLNVRPMYGTLAGTVTDAADGSPIPKAVVEIEPLSIRGERLWYGWSKHTVITDEKGRYSVEWMWEGDYRIAAYTDGAFAYYPNAVTGDLSDPVPVVGGETSIANFALVRRNEGPCVIRGAVSSDYSYWRNDVPADSSGNGDSTATNPVRILKTLDGTPMEGAVVIAKPVLSILSWPESERFFNAVSKADGTYEITGLPEGDYYVMAFGGYHMPAYYDHTHDPAEATPVSVTPSAAAEGIDLALSPMVWMMRDAVSESGLKNFTGTNGASVNGSVTDSNGNRVTGAVVILLNEAGEPLVSATTNGDGDYSISGVPAGNYVLQAGKLGFATAYNGAVAAFGDAQPLAVGNGTLEVNFRLGKTAAVPQKPGRLPEHAVLRGNYPNPFNPETTIRFELAAPSNVRLTVIDLAGRSVRSLWNGPAEAGRNLSVWNGKDDAGKPVSSGAYLIRLESSDGVRTGKMILIR
jgi:protocatechuate 3,4-dioxygenase beta subunit